MLRLRAGDAGRRVERDSLGHALAGAGYLTSFVLAALGPGDRVGALTAILAIAAVAAGLLVVGERGGLSISASFLVYVLAAAFLGTVSAALSAVLSEVVAALRLRTRLRSVTLINLPTNMLPAVLAALIVHAFASRPSDTAVFYFAVAVAGVVALVRQLRHVHAAATV